MKDFDEFLKTLDSKETVESIEHIYKGVMKDPSFKLQNGGVPCGRELAMSYYIALSLLRKYHTWSEE